MRRRSERKKSTDTSSPAVATTARRSIRRRKSSEKAAEDFTETSEEAADNVNRASSEEHEVVEKTSRRGRRRRTPVSSPSKRKNRHSESPESKIAAIPEEDNNGATNEDNNIAETTDGGEGQQIKNVDEERKDDNEGRETMETPRNLEGKNTRDTDDVKDVSKEHKDEEEVNAERVSEEVKQKEVIGNSRSLSPKAIVDEKPEKAMSDILDLKEDSQQGQEPTEAAHRETEVNSRNEDVCNQETATKIDDNSKEPVAVPIEDSRDSEYNGNMQHSTKSPPRVSKELDSNENSIQMDTNINEQDKSIDTNNCEIAQNVSSNNSARTQRKRKWLTKKAFESSKTPILAISTDSLKGLISDVHPVPLSDVRLDSSPEIEEVASEREEGEKTPSPRQREERSRSPEKVLTIEKPIIKRTISRDPIATVPIATAGATVVKVQRPPSPARNKTSNVLYITNLVRPFTVMQLKSLLARTGKIVEDGFWIDRIKSKCYVQYETEDEAIETRHALHGVRWPVSNPKCLNVDFGKKADMDRAIETTKDEAPKLGQDSKDNVIVGTGWSRGERTEEVDRKSIRPVREWDVGKKDTVQREREKNREVVKRRSRERDVSSNRENEKSSSDRKARNRERRGGRSRSASPVRKLQKKENEPPLRLLDDLFRKTKSAPCIYWLPLTPEQIAEKEALRQKRILDRQERVKQLEQEREKEREKERENRNRGNERDRDRSRDRDRHNRSSDRRRSRSRDRRRY